MEITKIFTFEGSHVVRNCTSHRCSHSVHGHSYKVELTLTGMKLDHAGMLMDFGLLKGPIKQFIDAFDHCHVMCAYDNAEYKDFFKEHNDRWIEIPFNPSAECLAILFHYYIQYIIDNTEFANGEGDIIVKSVKVHETATGSATSSPEDVMRYWKPNYACKFSHGVLSDWDVPLFNMISGPYKEENKMPEQQIMIPGFNDEVTTKQQKLFDEEYEVCN